MMQQLFISIVPNIAVAIEILGLIILIIAVVRSFFKIIIDEKLDFILSGKDLLLDNGILIAMEFFLAAEIIKTLVAKDATDLFHVGILVFIRIVITVIVHWEIRQKGAVDHLDDKIH